MNEESAAIASASTPPANPTPPARGTTTAAHALDARAGGALLGLRERKKRRTHETIARVALDLFVAQGFRATTIAQIAEAADVSPRTVSAYFPAKEDLLFPNAREAIDELGERLAARPHGEYAVDTLRQWIAELLDELEADPERERERARRMVIDADEALCAYERLQMERAERMFAEAVARDLGTEPDDVAAQLASAAAVAALTAVGRVPAAEVGQKDPAAHRDAALAVVDQAIVFLRGGVAALRAHRGEPPLRAPGDAPEDRPGASPAG